MKLDPNDPVDQFLATIPGAVKGFFKAVFTGKDLDGGKIPWAFRGFFISMFLLIVLHGIRLALTIGLMVAGKPVPHTTPRTPVVIPKPVMIAP